MMWLQFHLFIIKLTILLFPFIFSVGEKGVFSGAGTNASFYPLLIGSISWGVSIIFRKKIIDTPKARSFKFLMLFIIIVFLSGIMNLPQIYTQEFQGVTGAKRYISQFATQILYIFFSLYIYNALKMCKYQSVEILKKYLVLSFLLAGLYSFFEILRNLGVGNSAEWLYSIDSIFRAESDIKMNMRVRSLTAEASMLGMYLSLVLPWLVLMLLENIKKVYVTVLILYLLILVFFSTSRTAYIDIALEMLIMMIAFRRCICNIIKKNKQWLLLVIFLLAFGMYIGGEPIPDAYKDIEISTVFLSIADMNGVNALSNVARYGSQYAAIGIWEDNPFWGVGYGCYGFYAIDYYPDWAWISPEIVSWASESGTWPPVHGLYARMLAEIGILGFAVLMCAFFMSYYEIFKLSKEGSQQYKNEMICFFVCFVAFFMFGFNFDGLSILPYWVFFGFLWNCYDRLIR